MRSRSNYLDCKGRTHAPSKPTARAGKAVPARPVSKAGRFGYVVPGLEAAAFSRHAERMLESERSRPLGFGR